MKVKWPTVDGSCKIRGVDGSAGASALARRPVQSSWSEWEWSVSHQEWTDSYILGYIQPGAVPGTGIDAKPDGLRSLLDPTARGPTVRQTMGMEEPPMGERGRCSLTR